VVKGYALPPASTDSNAVFKNLSSDQDVKLRVKKLGLGKTELVAPITPVDLHKANINVVPRTQKQPQGVLV
jgi:hypothetical protein